MLNHVTIPGPPGYPCAVSQAAYINHLCLYGPPWPGVNPVCQPGEGSMRLSPQSAWTFLAAISTGRGHPPGLQLWGYGRV